MYGIPEFRLPSKDRVASDRKLRNMGVEIRSKPNQRPDLHHRRAVRHGLRCGVRGLRSRASQVFGGARREPDRHLFRQRVPHPSELRAYLFPEYDTPIKIGKVVAVVGGGNVAMDAARTALRLGAEKVIVLYRRTESEMPARVEEVHHAKEEGIEFHFLVNPVRFLGENGRVEGVECVRMELGQADESGRPRPVAVKGSNFVVPIHTAVIAIGNDPHPLVPRTTPGLEVTRWGTVVANEEGATSRVGVFAGGDIVTGAATVISAMGAGKRAARAIHRHLTEKKRG